MAIKKDNKPYRPTRAELDELRSINSVGTSISKMNMETRKSIDSTMGSSYKSLNKYGDKNVREITSSVSKILNKFSLTIDALSRGVTRITLNTAKATKDTLTQYGKAVGQDFNINKQNAVAMALSQSSPIFGYFAAKFVETDIFQNAVERMKEHIGKSLSSIGYYLRFGWEKFKSKIGIKPKRNNDEGDDFFDSPSKASYRVKNIPKLKKGGLISKSGIVYVHAGEVVSPVDKVLGNSKYSIGQLFNSGKSLNKDGWLYKIYDILLELRVSMTGIGYDFKTNLYKKIMGNPVFKKMAMAFSLFKATTKFLFKVRNRYERELPRSTNLQANIADTLGLTYIRSMEKYDQMLFYLRRLSAKITGEDVTPPGNPSYTNYKAIKAFISGIKNRGVKQTFSDIYQAISGRVKSLTGNTHSTLLLPDGTVSIIPNGSSSSGNSIFGSIKGKTSGVFNYFRGAGVAAIRNREGKKWKHGTLDHRNGVIDYRFNLNEHDLAAEEYYNSFNHATAGGLFNKGKHFLSSSFHNLKNKLSLQHLREKFGPNTKEDRIEKRLRLIQENTSDLKDETKKTNKKNKGFFSTLGMVAMGIYSAIRNFVGTIPLIGKPLQWMMSFFKFKIWDLPNMIWGVISKGLGLAWKGAKLGGRGLMGLGRGLGGLFKGGSKGILGRGLGIFGVVDSVIDMFKSEGNADKMFGGHASLMQKGFAGVGGLLGGEDQGQSSGGLSGIWGMMKGAFFGAIRGATIGSLFSPGIGTAVGAAVGGVCGMIGPDRIARWLNKASNGIGSVLSSIGDIISHPIESVESAAKNGWSWMSNGNNKFSHMIAGAAMGGLATGGNPFGIIGGAIMGWYGSDAIKRVGEWWGKMGIGSDALPQGQYKDSSGKALPMSIPNYLEDAQNKAKIRGKTLKNIFGNAQYDDIINKAAKDYGVDPKLIKGIINTESEFNPNAKGPMTHWGRAKGLMQIIDDTSRGLGIKNSLNPEENIRGGTKYFASLVKQYGGNVRKALAVYGGHIHTDPTNYIKKVLEYSDPKINENRQTIAERHVADKTRNLEELKELYKKQSAESSKQSDEAIKAMEKNFTNFGQHITTAVTNNTSSNVNNNNQSGSNHFDPYLNAVVTGDVH